MDKKLENSTKAVLSLEGSDVTLNTVGEASGQNQVGRGSYSVLDAFNHPVMATTDEVLEPKKERKKSIAQQQKQKLLSKLQFQ